MTELASISGRPTHYDYRSLYSTITEPGLSVTSNVSRARSEPFIRTGSDRS